MTSRLLSRMPPDHASDRGVSGCLIVGNFRYDMRSGRLLERHNRNGEEPNLCSRTAMQ
jgi:hypothetical protein